jgi:hypothetical protein
VEHNNCRMRALGPDLAMSSPTESDCESLTSEGRENDAFSRGFAIVHVEFDARLALGQIELKFGKVATTKGYNLTARKAAGALKESGIVPRTDTPVMKKAKAEWGRDVFVKVPAIGPTERQRAI